MLAQVSQERLWGQIVAKAWSDQEFKQRLLADPGLVFAEYGFEVPEGVEVMLHEETPNLTHFILPARPDGDLLEEELVGNGAPADSFSGFSGFCGRCGRCGCGCGRCD